ncbi:MAG: GNAT family N-acetyltransferase [Firmicutes bacterium]|nr:GNAT family N-acetyltransferase [Bacillota bacterium]
MLRCKLRDGNILVLREVEAKDAESIIEYVNKVAGETDNLTFGENQFNITLKEERKILIESKKSENSFFLLAIINDRIVGMLTFRGGKRPRTKHVGEFGVSVLKEFWNLGIGKKMIINLIKWAKDNKIKKINLRVRSDNEKAIKLYKNLGFLKEGVITKELFINGKFYDAVAMGYCIE